MEEEEMIARIRARDEAGAQALLRRCGPLIRYVAAPILPDERDREECLSEVALRVWENIGRFDPGRGSWNAWLTALTRNAALNMARRARREDGEALSEASPAPGPTPEESLVRAERAAALRRALETLAPGERALFYRKYYYRQSAAQIAAELGLTPRAVEGRLYRLKTRLRKALGGEEDAL